MLQWSTLLGGSRRDASVSVGGDGYVYVAGTRPYWQEVGGKSSAIVFSGPAPRQPQGVTQINFVVPELAPGCYEIYVTSGSLITSQAGVTVVIR